MPLRHASPQDTAQAVDAFLAALAHPRKDDIERLRALMREVDPAVAEGIKWNAPSWRTDDYFATTHLRARGGLALVLHRGAKARALPAGGLAIDDPLELLSWRDADRALVDLPDVERLRPALLPLLRQWVRLL